MPRLPEFLSKTERAELEQTDEGRAEIRRISEENDRIWPEPTLGDILELKQQLQDDRQLWADKVKQVRVARYNLDTTPPKWATKLNIPDDRRIHTNNTGNEINRVVAMLERNPPRITISPSSDSNPAIQRAEKQARWCQQLLKSVERDKRLPVWQRGSDAAAETGLGGFELYMTEAWEAVEKLIEQLDPDSIDTDEQKQLQREIDEAKKAAGLPFALRPLDALSILLDPEDPDSPALIIERKHYRQIYQKLREKLSKEKLDEIRLPRPGQRAWPDSERLVRYEYDGIQGTYDASPVGERGDLVEVIRYYDKRWLVEVVAGRITECVEHHWPGIPVFPQLGKVTSSSNSEWMLQGITFGMTSLELALNDLFTLALDSQYTYGRPFPVVSTSENGSPLFNKEGQPDIVRLDDPARPPQLGPGQTIVDAFGGFNGNIENQFLQVLQSYWQRSGLNAVAQGESPGADPSGFALNTLNVGAEALYESILDNKVQTLGSFCDFVRQSIRTTIGESITLSVPSQDGQGEEYLSLGPDDIDQVPTTVFIDPKSDLQRLSIISMLTQAWQQGLITKRHVQVLGLTGIVEDPDEENNQIALERMEAMIDPMIVASVLKQVEAESFPELAPPAGPGGMDGGMGGPPPMGPGDLQQMGATPPRPVSVGNPAPKPGVAQSNRARGGVQPPSQGVPALG